MSYTFDGANKRIRLGAGTTSLSLPDLYSRWKDWVLLGNGGYLPAFTTVGGDIPAIPLYCFLENGWRIVPQSADHALAVVDGILEVRGGGEPFVDPDGDFSIRITRQAPGIAIGYNATGGGGSTDAPNVDQIADAVKAILASDLNRILVAAQSGPSGSGGYTPGAVTGLSSVPVAVIPSRPTSTPSQSSGTQNPDDVLVVPAKPAVNPVTQASTNPDATVVVITHP